MLLPTSWSKRPKSVGLQRRTCWCKDNLGRGSSRRDWFIGPKKTSAYVTILKLVMNLYRDGLQDLSLYRSQIGSYNHWNCSQDGENLEQLIWPNSSWANCVMRALHSTWSCQSFVTLMPSLLVPDEDMYPSHMRIRLFHYGRRIAVAYWGSTRNDRWTPRSSNWEYGERGPVALLISPPASILLIIVWNSQYLTLYIWSTSHLYLKLQCSILLQPV